MNANKRNLTAAFSFFLVIFLVFTVRASLERNVIEGWQELYPDKWFQATFADAVLAFLAISAWMFYKERSWGARLGWFAAIMTLGNGAIMPYILLQIWKSDGSAAGILLRQPRGISASSAPAPRKRAA